MRGSDGIAMVGCALQLIWLFVWVMVVVGLIYAGFHFIAKFW